MRPCLINSRLPRAVLLLVLSVFSIVVGILVLPTFPCTIVGPSTRRCYEQDAKIWLEIYTTVESNNKSHAAFYLCGPVLNCAESPCYFDLDIGRQVRCTRFSDHFYQIIPPLAHSSLPILGLVTGLLALSLLILLIVEFHWDKILRCAHRGQYQTIPS